MQEWIIEHADAHLPGDFSGSDDPVDPHLDVPLWELGFFELGDCNSTKVL